MNTCVVIPARNEANTIREVVLTARHQVHQVIVVDDGSEDGMIDRIRDLDLILIQRPAPGGKGAALADGFSAALDTGAQAVITLDGDGQHDPHAIGRLIEAHQACPGHLVLGARIVNRQNQPGIRRFANRFADFWISWASGQRLPDSQTGFRLYPRSLLETVHPSTKPRHGFVFETTMLIEGAHNGFPFVSVAVESIYRPGIRASYFRPGRDVWEIFWHVFWKIVSRGLYLPGLYRMIRYPARIYPG